MYLYVEEAEPDAGRLTRDIDIAVLRTDLDRIVAAADQFGVALRHVAGVDTLVRKDQPTRRALHLVYAAAEIRPHWVRQFPLVPLADLVRMKLTSFRLKDQVHLKDMDEAGLITEELVSTLPADLAARLADVRSRD